MINEYISKTYTFLTNLRSSIRRESKSSISSNESEHFLQYLCPSETKIINLQSIIIWEKPKKSVLFILTVNIIYWYLVFSDVQLYFGLSCLSLAAFLHHQWIFFIWPEISVPNINIDQEEWTPVHPSIISAPELSRYLRNCLSYSQEQYIRLTQLRRKQPGLFCTQIVALFTALWVFGHFVPGVILIYTSLMGVMCIPGFIIHCMPNVTSKSVGDLFSTIFRNRIVFEDNEADFSDFLPEDEEDQRALEIPFLSLESTLNEDERVQALKNASCRTKKTRKRKNRNERSTASAEKGGVSFTFGLSENDFPSIEDSAAFDETDHLLPGTPAGLTLITTNVSDEDIQFVPTHFGDIKLEDELSWTSEPSPSGIRSERSHAFTTSTVQQFTPSVATTVMSHLMQSVPMENTAALLSTFSDHFVNALSSAVDSPVQLSTSESSTTDDFELISDDNLQ